MNDVPRLSLVILIFGTIYLPRVSHNIVGERVNYILWKEDVANLTCNFNLLKAIFLIGNRTKNWGPHKKFSVCQNIVCTYSVTRDIMSECLGAELFFYYCSIDRIMFQEKGKTVVYSLKSGTWWKDYVICAVRLNHTYFCSLSSVRKGY